MTHVISQETSLGLRYVTSVNHRGELVLGSDERKEAKKFFSEEEAQRAVSQTPSPIGGIELVQLIHPVNGPFKPTSPLGHVLQACEEKPGVENLEQLRAAIPKHVSGDLNDDELWTLVKRQTELLLEWPHTVDLLLMIRHVETDHHKAAQKRRRHAHPAERDYETREIIRPSKQDKHSHDDDIERLRKEVREMATATKTKPKAKAREKKEKVQRDCHCGCGGVTFANFQPGHDARIYALLRKVSKGEKGVKFPKVLTDNKELFAAMQEKAH